MSETNLRKKAKTITSHIHKYVENLPIMKEIMSSNLDPKRYLKYLIQIQGIYNAIESNKTYSELDWNLYLAENYQSDINSIQTMFGICELSLIHI